MSAPLSVEIAEGRCQMRFNLVNRRLSSNLDDYIRVIQDKCENEFDILEIFWEKGQSHTSEIGQVLTAVKSKRGLTALRLTISDNNKLQQHFAVNLGTILSNNRETLTQFALSIGCKCLQPKVLNPVMEAVNRCKLLSQLSIQVREKNNLEQEQFHFQLEGMKLVSFRWKCRLESDVSLASLGACLQTSSACFSTLREWKLVLNVGKQLRPEDIIRLDYLGMCESLLEVTLKANVTCFQLNEKTFSSAIQTLKIRENATPNLLQCLQQLVNLRSLKLELLDCTTELCQDLRLSLPQLVQANPHLEMLSLVLVIQQLVPSTIVSLFEIRIESLELGFKILERCSYETLFALCTVAAGCSYPPKSYLQLSTQEITLTARMTSTSFRLDIVQNQERSQIVHTKDFPEMVVLGALAETLVNKGIRDAIVTLDPCLSSNYSRFKIHLYHKLFSVNLHYLKVKISNEFEIGCNELLVNVDDSTGEMLQLVLESVEHGPINKLIIYHNLDVSVKRAYRRLVDLFQRKIFLCFCNYFVYTETRTPEYTKMIKPCEKQAELYQRRVLQFEAVRRKWAHIMREWEYDFLLELVIPEIVVDEIRKPHVESSVEKASSESNLANSLTQSFLQVPESGLARVQSSSFQDQSDDYIEVQYEEASPVLTASTVNPTGLQGSLSVTTISHSP